ncbi:helix-turn-helix domain-containing protein [Mycobacterium intracellulare]|uniref:helix-turn-helix domain-containing protein n=1 Tax=Mycobacterium intracellulare TaxID=1767 RepID=UPI0035564F1A
MGLADAAKEIGTTERWLANQLRAGRFPAHKVGRQWRFTDRDIAEIIRLCAVPVMFAADAGFNTPASSMTPTTARRIRNQVRR